MATKNRVNTGSCNSLLPDDTKPLPEPILSSHSQSDIHPKSISQPAPSLSFCMVSLKIILLKLSPHLPGTNGFRYACKPVVNTNKHNKRKFKKFSMWSTMIFLFSFSVNLFCILYWSITRGGVDCICAECSRLIDLNIRTGTHLLKILWRKNGKLSFCTMFLF